MPVAFEAPDLKTKILIPVTNGMGRKMEMALPPFLEKTITLEVLKIGYFTDNARFFMQTVKS